MKSTDAAKKAMTTPSEPKKELKDSDYLSTGLTQINLATYGRVDGGMVKGKIYRVIGPSESGKTFLCRTILAEASINPNFDGYDLIYDDVERGALMDTAKFYGQALVDRLTAPGKTISGKPIYSKTIGDFYARVMKRLEAGRSFVWIEDSMDSLEEESMTKMGDGKAKINAQNLRKMLNGLDTTGSIMVLVCQAKIDMRSMFGGQITSGGDALKFYSTWDCWLSSRGSIKTEYKGQKYTVGSKIAATIKKNRLSGRNRTIYFNFDPNFGIDDIGSNVDFLTRVKYWPKTKTGIEWKKGEVLSRSNLIRMIEEKNLERYVANLVSAAWQEIESALTSERKPRYS